MNSPFQIVYHNIDQSEALSEMVNKRIKKLGRFNGEITGGRVVLDSPHNNHHKGKVYSVSLEIHTPAKEVRVKQEQHDKHAHEDLYVAVRDAFNTAERQLKAASRVDKPGKKRRQGALGKAGFGMMPEEELGAGMDTLDAEYEDSDFEDVELSDEELATMSAGADLVDEYSEEVYGAGSIDEYSDIIDEIGGPDTEELESAEYSDEYRVA